MTAIITTPAVFNPFAFGTAAIELLPAASQPIVGALRDVIKEAEGLGIGPQNIRRPSNPAFNIGGEPFVSITERYSKQPVPIPVTKTYYTTPPSTRTFDIRIGGQPYDRAGDLSGLASSLMYSDGSTALLAYSLSIHYYLEHVKNLNRLVELLPDESYKIRRCFDAVRSMAKKLVKMPIEGQMKAWLYEVLGDLQARSPDEDAPLQNYYSEAIVLRFAGDADEESGGADLQDRMASARHLLFDSLHSHGAEPAFQGSSAAMDIYTRLTRDMLLPENFQAVCALRGGLSAVASAWFCIAKEGNPLPHSDAYATAIWNFSRASALYHELAMRDAKAYADTARKAERMFAVASSELAILADDSR